LSFRDILLVQALHPHMLSCVYGIYRRHSWIPYGWLGTGRFYVTSKHIRPTHRTNTPDKHTGQAHQTNTSDKHIRQTQQVSIMG